jgi:hypothetical protein
VAKKEDLELAIIVDLICVIEHRSKAGGRSAKKTEFGCPLTAQVGSAR